MEQREPRKRIPLKNRTIGEPIDDPEAYISNKCSQRARKIRMVTPELGFSIWFDQHYQTRTQFGDEQGVRIGIEADRVESLVNRAMNHLMSYSAILKTFHFVNYQNSIRNERVVLQEETGNGILNVVVEVHLIGVGIYEVTVKTAMCTDNFMISDGQYSIQLFENESVLRKKEKGVMRDIGNI